jgi:hypothetical protein
MTPKLSYHQELMLKTSHFDESNGRGFGVELSSAANFRTARSLVKLELGWIEEDAAGERSRSLFFANHAGTAIAYPAKAAEWNGRLQR